MQITIKTCGHDARYADLPPTACDAWKHKATMAGAQTEILFAA
ncbi:hypothetical protein [Burkholderia thailandensis]|nr:hypothetical protein [Burkholderia thailandensis]